MFPLAFRHVSAAVLLLLAMALVPSGSRADDVDIPYQKFVLKNGLTLLVHEDHKAPIVAVNVWHYTGSKNEKPGKTGFAHLFEHLMFNGSEHFNDDYFKAMEKIGATNLNGTTSNDRTNYFENVPTSALDTALWMESDRMGHMIGAITQAKLDEQRGVVQNEKRQGENQPYAIMRELSAKGCFPPGHPYSWTVIGSMDDLSSATLADVHQWFKTYYGAANAVLCVAGDVKPQEVRKKVEKYFGDIAAGPPIARPKAWVARRTGTVRQVAQDRVPQAAITKIWNVPQWGTREAALLDLAAGALGSGKTSRLYKRLVYDEQLATEVYAYNESREIAGLFNIFALARPGVELKKVEKAIDEELARFLKDGPTEKELARIRTQERAGLIRGLEGVGGFGGKSDRLLEGQTYGGNPTAYRNYLKFMTEATVPQVQALARQWLADGVFILEVHPYPEFQTVKSDADRTTMAQPGTPPEVKFATFERATLSNGLKVILARRNTLPLVNMSLQIDAGDAADPADRQGLANLVMGMLDEGTPTRSALEISEELDNLGAELGAGSGRDTCSVSLSTLKENLDPALALYADVILHPAFPEADFARIKKQALAGLQQAKVTPAAMAGRVVPRLLYGAEHPYGALVTEAAVGATTREDLVKFHQAWFKPGSATLIVAGATTLEVITAKLETLFKEWPRGAAPQKTVGEAKLAEKPAIYLIDKPDAQQSYVMAAHIAPPRANPDEVAIETLNALLGGQFTSRINMNLREDKHWSYGARSGFGAARGPRLFAVAAPVQGDKTREAMLEMIKELREIQQDRPVTQAEFDKTQLNKVLSLGGKWETMGAVQGAIAEIVSYGLADDFWQAYPGKVRELKLEDVNRVARKVLHPDRVIWVVAGDRAKIQKPLEELAELGFGAVRVIDADAQPAK